MTLELVCVGLFMLLIGFTIGCLSIHATKAKDSPIDEAIADAIGRLENGEAISVHMTCHRESGDDDGDDEEEVTDPSTFDYLKPRSN